MHKHNAAHSHNREPDPEALKAGHEVGDVAISPLVKFAIGLSILAAVSMAFAWGTFVIFAGYKARTTTAPTPMQVLQHAQQPPEPRLQVHALKDWVGFKAEQDSLVATYGWMDKEKGVVRIPVERALDILSERAWPHKPGAYGRTGLSDAGSVAPGAETPEGGH